MFIKTENSNHWSQTRKLDSKMTRVRLI